MDKKSKSFFTKKKIFIFGGILVVLFLIIWFLLKSFYIDLFTNYSSGVRSEIVNAISNKENVIINHSTNQGKYFETKNIKFINNFNDCYLTGTSKDYLRYSCDIGTFSIEKTSNLINYSFMTNPHMGIYRDRFKKISNSFLERNNIKSGSDLIEYLGNYKEEEPSIFSSYNNINDSIIVSGISNAFALNHNLYKKEGKFYVISGDYSGYVFEIDNSYDFYIKNKDTYYLIRFSLSDNKLSRNDVYKMISTVVIS